MRGKKSKNTNINDQGGLKVLNQSKGLCAIEEYIDAYAATERHGFSCPTMINQPKTIHWMHKTYSRHNGYIEAKVIAVYTKITKSPV